MGHSRLQAPFTTISENPNLQPRAAQIDINASRGRFQHVNLGYASAEDRTRIPDRVLNITKTLKVSTPQPQAEKVETRTETTTTIIE